MASSFWNSRPVLVTGGAGFLGSHLVESLVGEGARVTVTDCVEAPHRLKEVLSRIEYVKADLKDPDALHALEGLSDTVFHLAAFAFPKGAQQDVVGAYRQNVEGTVNVLEWARKRKVRKLLFSSAAALYPSVAKYLPIDEKHPIDPAQSVYALTKRIGELLCEEYRKDYDLPTLYFRIFNTYGPRQSTIYLIPSFFVQGYEKGKIKVLNGAVRRDFVFVRDVVDALMRGGEVDDVGGPLNIGTGRGSAVGEIARKIGNLLGVEVELGEEEVFGSRNQACDATLARKVLAWEPKVSLDEGLKLTFGSFKETLVSSRE